MNWQWFWLSRPRFWLYVLGPYVVGQAAAGRPESWLWTVALGLFFTYPANFIIYGVNDAYDYETDKLNPKKASYEILLRPTYRHVVLQQAYFWALVGLLLILLAPGNHVLGLIAYIGFLFFGVYYSSPPIRAKTKPVLDSVYNVLYVFPGVLAWVLATGSWPDWRLFAAATAWCMAMHAYSAVPDIDADQKAGINTIATWLGARPTLLFCTACYAAAAALSVAVLGWFSVVSGALYILLMLISLLAPDRERVFKMYIRFPILNMLVGMALFFYVASSQI